MDQNDLIMKQTPLTKEAFSVLSPVDSPCTVWASVYHGWKFGQISPGWTPLLLEGLPGLHWTSTSSAAGIPYGTNYNKTYTIQVTTVQRLIQWLSTMCFCMPYWCSVEMPSSRFSSASSYSAILNRSSLHAVRSCVSISLALMEARMWKKLTPHLSSYRSSI